MVNTQLVSPVRLMAMGRGPCRNISAAIIMGIGPGHTQRHYQPLHH